MRKSAISACVAFLAVANIASAQEEADPTVNQDPFSEAVDDHIEGEIKKKIRQDLTKKSLDAIGNKTLSDLAKKIPGALAKKSPLGKYLAFGKATAEMAFGIRPAGEGSDIVDIPPQAPFEETRETQWCINSCLSVNGGDPASSAYQQCVANNCYPSQTASPPPKPQLSNAASYLANQHIGDGCQGRGGSIDPRGLTIRDLDGDGRDDLIIADEWIVCNGARQQSITCGVKVCEAVIYVRRGTTLERSASFNGTGVEVSTGNRPTVTFLEHNLSRFSFGWNGSAFAQR